MKREFTATTYILHNEKVLLIYHKKLQKWLPPGGHLEENETPPEAAMRETLEESGLEIEFLFQENIVINSWNAKSFVRPYLCLLEEIPTYKDIPPHQHIDMVYVARPCGGKLIDDPLLRWFTLQEVAAMKSDVDIFHETQQVIEHLMAQNLILQTASNPV